MFIGKIVQKIRNSLRDPKEVQLFGAPSVFQAAIKNILDVEDVSRKNKKWLACVLSYFGTIGETTLRQEPKHVNDIFVSDQEGAKLQFRFFNKSNIEEIDIPNWNGAYNPNFALVEKEPQYLRYSFFHYALYQEPIRPSFGKYYFTNNSAYGSNKRDGKMCVEYANSKTEYIRASFSVLHYSQESSENNSKIVTPQELLLVIKIPNTQDSITMLENTAQDVFEVLNGTDLSFYDFYKKAKSKLHFIAKDYHLYLINGKTRAITNELEIVNGKTCKCIITYNGGIYTVLSGDTWTYENETVVIGKKNGVYELAKTIPSHLLDEENSSLSTIINQAEIIIRSIKKQAFFTD